MAWNEPGPNGRDPWNQGNRNSGDQGPPDLDAMLKKLRARLIGNRTGGGPSVPRVAGSAGMVLAVIALLWMLSGFYIIDEQQQGVVFRFGAFAGVSEPGPRWHLPWPIETVEKVKLTEVRNISDRAVMLTQDENIIDVDLSVQYRVKSAFDFVVNLDDPELTLRQATKAAVREVVGQNLMDTILTEGRQAIADKTKVLLQERLDEYKSGLVVNEVNLKQVQPPEAVQAAFQDAIRAREDLERKKNEAQAYANDRLPKARGMAARNLAEASAYRDQVVARAEGDAARFSALLTEYRKAPQVTRERLYLDTMQDVLGRTNKVLVDPSKANPNFYLPLDQLLKGKSAEPVAPPEAPSAGNDAPPPPRSSIGDTSRSRAR
jgi:modulator of FtsH protease HflK